MSLIETLIEKAKQSPKRVALPECEADKTLLAARRVKDEGIGIPVLVNDPAVIRETAARVGVSVDDMEIVDIADEEFKAQVIAKYMEYPADKRQLSEKGARRKMGNPMYYAMIMEAAGYVDCTFCGHVNNYMLEKEQYSQQDIDYAFRMNYMEKNGTEKKAPVQKNRSQEDFRDKYQSASWIYISLFMDKIFHGLKEKWMGGKASGGLSTEAMRDDALVNKWFDDFFMDRVKSKQKEFRMIIRGLYRAMESGEPGRVTYEKMRNRISDMLTRTLADRLFSTRSVNEAELYGKYKLDAYTLQLGTNKEFQFSGVINHMITACLKEGSEKPLDKMVND